MPDLILRYIINNFLLFPLPLIKNFPSHLHFFPTSPTPGPEYFYKKYTPVEMFDPSCTYSVRCALLGNIVYNYSVNKQCQHTVHKGLYTILNIFLLEDLLEDALRCLSSASSCLRSTCVCRCNILSRLS